jgi:hypothetical protein
MIPTSLAMAAFGARTDQVQQDLILIHAFYHGALIDEEVASPFELLASLAKSLVLQHDTHGLIVTRKHGASFVVHPLEDVLWHAVAALRAQEWGGVLLPPAIIPMLSTVLGA